jgi:hypothetical protein
VTPPAAARVHFLEPGEDRIEFARLGEREVKVLREAVVAEVAALEGRTALEHERLAKRRPRQAHEEPSQAVVAFEDRLDDAATTGAGEAVRQQREVALRNHRSSPHERSQLLRFDVDANPPPRVPRSFGGHERIERRVSRGQRRAKPLDLGGCIDLERLE